MPEPSPQLLQAFFDISAMANDVLVASRSVDLEKFELSDDEPVWDELSPQLELLFDNLWGLRSEVSAKLLDQTEPVAPNHWEESTDLDRKAPSPIRDRHEDYFGELLSQVTPGDYETLCSSVSALVHCSTDIVQEHLVRLRHPALQADRGALLSDVHEFLSKTEHLLETLLGTLLRCLEPTADPEDTPLILGGRRAASIRIWAREFENALEAAAQGTPESLEQVLSEYAHAPQMRWLRATDRAQVQDFRRAIDENINLERLEEFRHWLGRMSRINDRKVLIEHDRRVLRLIDGALANNDMDTVRQNVEWLYGRHRALDEAIVALRNSPEGRIDSVCALLPDLHQTLVTKARG